MLRESQKYKIIYLTLIGFIALTALTMSFSAAAEPKRIALLPFKINAERDMTYMQNGIFDMLSSRLAQEGEVVVIGRQEAEAAIQSIGGLGAVNEASARKIGSQLNADYTLFGSLTVLGESISIDAKMVDVTGNTSTASFFEQSQDLGGVITKINQIATQINATLFGRQTEVAQKAAPEATAAPASKPAPADERHAHPEKLLKGGGAEGEWSPFIMATEEEKEEQGRLQKFWRSAKFKHVVNGIAIGDVDRDGKMETVVVTPHEMIIYRAEGGPFYKVNEIQEGDSTYNIGVDIADINDNGYPEIFVTRLNGTRQGVNSTVYEYDGKNYNKVVESSSWYYRVAEVSGRGKILLGQKHRMAQPFSGRIYDLVWQNSEYVPGAEIKTPGKIQVMGFTLGDILNDKQETAVAYRDDDRIQVIDANGKEMWKSSEKYGGSTLFSTGEKQYRGEVQNRLYYPMRLLAMDTNGDGESEVIVVKNFDVVGRKLEKFRKYTSAHIESLVWDGLGLATKWKTRKISGFIRDYALEDFDNDGRLELVAVVILDEGSVVLLSEPKSMIIAYELPS